MDDAEMVPRAGELTQTLYNQACDFRSHCEDMLKSHEKALGFWKHEYEIVTTFLQEDLILDRSAAAPKLEQGDDEKRELEYEMGRRGTRG